MAIMVLAFAIIGSARYLHRIEHPARVSDIAYLVILTFTANLPSVPSGGGYPWELEIARFCAPLLIAYATILLALVVFRQKFDETRARRSRDHIVVCGLGEVGQSVIASLGDHRRKLVVIDRSPLEEAVREARSLGALVLIGDARDGLVLQRAAVGRAENIVLVCGPDDVNGDVLVAIQQFLASSQVRKPSIQVNLRSLELAEQLARHDLRFGPSAECPVDYSCLVEVGARRMLSRHPPGPDVASWPELVLVGDGPFVEALVLQVARVRARADGSEALEVAIVGTSADHLISQLESRHPELQNVLALSVETGPVLVTGVRNRLKSSPESAVYVCLEDSDQSLTLALKLQLEDRPPCKIVVESMRNLTWLGSLQGRAFGSPTVENFGILDEVCDPETLLGGSTEELARAIHEAFVAEQRAAQSRGPINTPESSLVPWSELSSELRQQNREQAKDIVQKLNAVGARVVPMLTVRPQPVEFSADDVELMAHMEHDRWTAQKTIDGWKYGPRSEEKKTHPSLIHYDKLDESEKDKDRDTVRQIPNILATVGIDVVRSGDAHESQTITRGKAPGAV
jgi:hypothetical protein